MSTNGWWARGTAALPSNAEHPVEESQRGLVLEPDIWNRQR
jgi:hypothetical protein